MCSMINSPYEMLLKKKKKAFCGQIIKKLSTTPKPRGIHIFDSILKKPLESPKLTWQQNLFLEEYL